MVPGEDKVDVADCCGRSVVDSKGLHTVSIT